MLLTPQPQQTSAAAPQRTCQALRVKSDGEQLVAQRDNGGARGDGFKLKEGRFSLGVRRKSFIIRAVGRCHRLPEGLRVPQP